MGINTLCTYNYICTEGICCLIISLLLRFVKLAHCTWYLLFKICPFVYRLHTFAAGNKTIRIMKRFLLIMALLCVTMAGFAKRDKIDLDDQSRSLLPVIEAYVDDRMLEFVISEDLGTLDILIEDVSGNVVYRSTINGNKGMIPLDLDLMKGEYVLIITSEEQVFWGNFSVK